MTETIRSFMDSIREKYLLPGFSLSVWHNNRLAASETIGVRSTNAPENLLPNSRFHLGSVTKPLTATMIATLVEARLLTWDTTLYDTFEEWRERMHPQLRAVTIEMLLRHTAGIQPFEENHEWDQVPRFSGSAAEKRSAFVAWLIERAPSYPPGQEHHYSNAGYSIAAVMAERLTGQTWEELMRSRLFEPLEMTSAGFGWPAQKHPSEPWGHRQANGTPDPHDPNDLYQLENAYIGPAGDVHSSMDDLSRFVNFHLQGLKGQSGFLAASTIKQLHDAPDGSYALGWNIRSFGSHHMGSAETFFACILLMPKDELAFAIATNYSFKETSDFASEILSGVRQLILID
jgi:D-alanyl-D-alanine carboxypeptidase